MTNLLDPQLTNQACNIVSILLQNTSDFTTLSSLCTPTCTFVSITYNNPALTRILPFAGRHVAEGPRAILDTFSTVDAIWIREEFTVDTLFAGRNIISLGADMFGSSKFMDTDAKNLGLGNVVDVGVFGSFTLQSRTTGKVVRSPYCVWCKVDMEKERVVYIQYLEDTMGTTSVLKKEDGYGRFEVFVGKEAIDV